MTINELSIDALEKLKSSNNSNKELIDELENLYKLYESAINYKRFLEKFQYDDEMNIENLEIDNVKAKIVSLKGKIKRRLLKLE